MIRKALLIPVNNKSEVLIQDRENHRPPRWGFFGGGIEEGEEIIEALKREIREELGFNIDEQDIVDLGIFSDELPEYGKIDRFAFMMYTDKPLDQFNVMEGKAAQYFTLDKARKMMGEFGSEADVKIIEQINEVLKTKTQNN